ncbi:serine palmitoyltransferase 2-like isoform X1 [Ostrea edulis]|uniref:serine palmitoyltransferase 2-like isoform X1 n=1 Tax=Ostrea edulis TaxID=37623 RepID=UPI0024AFEC9C|nr:serine palmitoyltransferase 2-like isoform X1 [Ostrea edulis]XP_048761653.2 serine palmitoyltransferase 2-like isoform X1 [Ostrea edulis]
MTIREIYNSRVEDSSQTVQALDNNTTSKRMSDILTESIFPGSIAGQGTRIPGMINENKMFYENGILKTKPSMTTKQHTNGHRRSLSGTPHGRSIKRKMDMDFQHNRKWGSKFYESFEDPPLWTSIMTYISFLILILVGHVREFLKKMGIGRVKNISEPYIPGFVPLYQTWESFYHWYIFRRGKDTLYRTICSVPGAEMDVMDRVTDDHYWTFRYTGTSTRTINFGSYNYLGFSQNSGPCAEAVELTVNDLGNSICASRQELGYLQIHKELDELVADYLGVEAAITVPMGFATNSMNMPALVGKGCLILSDELNHASLILGCRLSGAQIRTFKHNCMEDLEKKLREAIIDQQPRTHRKWDKILIVVEGIYSMEGTIVKLPDVVRLKRKYKAFVYLDEAHSIGAIGSHGKGVVDYFGMDPKDIDIMMGTFTKSFGAVGGYIGGSKRLINHLRLNSHSSIYSSTMAPSIVQQVISSMKIILGRDNTRDGIKRINQLKWNTRYFRRRLQEMGFIVYGNKDSPVIPMVTFNPAKVVYFSRYCLEQGIGVTVAAFPAVPLEKSRIRFCLSASHTKEMLDKVLEMTDVLGNKLSLKLSRKEPANYDDSDNESDQDEEK